MSDVAEIPKKLRDTAVSLAASHRKHDPSTTEILWAPNEAMTEIRFIEVSAAMLTSGEVFPFRFNPAPEKGIDYASIVVLLSLDEWDEVQAGRLELPQGWTLSEFHRI